MKIFHALNKNQLSFAWFVHALIIASIIPLLSSDALPFVLGYYLGCSFAATFYQEVYRADSLDHKPGPLLILLLYLLVTYIGLVYPLSTLSLVMTQIFNIFNIALLPMLCFSHIIGHTNEKIDNTLWQLCAIHLVLQIPEIMILQIFPIPGSIIDFGALRITHLMNLVIWLTTAFYLYIHERSNEDKPYQYLFASILTYELCIRLTAIPFQLVRLLPSILIPTALPAHTYLLYQNGYSLIQHSTHTIITGLAWAASYLRPIRVPTPKLPSTPSHQLFNANNHYTKPVTFKQPPPTNPEPKIK